MMKNPFYVCVSVSALALMASACTDSPPAEASSSEFDISNQPTVVQDADAMPAGGPGGGGGFGGRGGPLIMREDVQAELGFSEEDVAEISGLIDEMEGDGGSEWQVVLDSGQLDRYQELSLQRSGFRALSRSEVADELGLSADQSAEIEAALEAGRPQRGEGGFDREAFMKLREEMNETILGVLTDAQEAKWEAMLGEQFEFQRQQRGGGQGAMQ